MLQSLSTLSIVLVCLAKVGIVFSQADICTSLCNSTPSCTSSTHGSYCKSWQSPQTCFGFVWTDVTMTSTCYNPADPLGCDTPYPVLCSQAPSVIPTATSDTTSTSTTTSTSPTTSSTTTSTSPTTGSATTSTSSTETTVSSTSSALTTADTYCLAACQGLASCTIGSYCKTTQSPAVCFGMYYRSDSKTAMCYIVDDPTCPQTTPVLCSEVTP